MKNDAPAPLRGVCIGAGYFSQFHYEAWTRIPQAVIIACCDQDAAKAEATQNRFGIGRCFTSVRRMFDQLAAESSLPDFVDVITPPPTHREICFEAADRGLNVICQKPLAPTMDEAREIVEYAEARGVRLMVHENFRFQPWHRRIRQLIDAGEIGDRLHTLTMRSRLGDGWGDDAYLARQPYFRDYPRLLVYETGIHFIDTFRFLAGDVRRLTAWLRRLNPVIKGEDCGLLVFEFSSGAIGVWDANRFNEPQTGVDARYTFGELLVEGSGGTIRLFPDGRLALQKLGQPERDVAYHHEHRGFGSDCVRVTQQHFVDCLLNGRDFETSGHDYLTNIRLQSEAYASAARHGPLAF